MNWTAFVAAIALFVGVWNIYLTHVATQVRDHEKWVRDSGLNLVARLYERISLFLREEGYLNTVLMLRIRDTVEPDDDDLLKFNRRQTEVDDLIREIDMFATQLEILAATELASVAQDVRSTLASRLADGDRNTIRGELSAAQSRLVESAKREFGRRTATTSFGRFVSRF